MYSEIARNKRRSVALVGVFFLSWILVGVALGALVTALIGHSPSSAPAQPSGPNWTPVIWGVVIGGFLALAGILYSLVAGARLVLRTSGAVPAKAAEHQQLLDLVGALAIGEGIPMPAVYVIEDGSPNAFATGLSPDKAAMTFTTGLLAIMDRQELEGVVSHEMSHIRNHDIRLLLIVGVLIGFAAFLSSLLWRTAFWGSIGEGDEGEGTGLVLVLIAAAALLALVGFLFGPLVRLALSRRRESLADASGVELTRNPAGLLSALKKLQANDRPFKGMTHTTAAMCIDDPVRHHEGWYHRLYDTHPPIEERIADLEKLALAQTI